MSKLKLCVFSLLGFSTFVISNTIILQSAKSEVASFPNSEFHRRIGFDGDENNDVQLDDYYYLDDPKRDNSVARIGFEEEWDFNPLPGWFDRNA